jgi:hypothetical protein
MGQMRTLDEFTDQYFRDHPDRFWCTVMGEMIARLWYDLSSVDVWRFYDGCYIPYFVH